MPSPDTSNPNPVYQYQSIREIKAKARQDFILTLTQHVEVILKTSTLTFAEEAYLREELDRTIKFLSRGKKPQT